MGLPRFALPAIRSCLRGIPCRVLGFMAAVDAYYGLHGLTLQARSCKTCASKEPSVDPIGAVRATFQTPGFEGGACAKRIAQWRQPCASFVLFASQCNAAARLTTVTSRRLLHRLCGVFLARMPWSPPVPSVVSLALAASLLVLWPCVCLSLLVVWFLTTSIVRVRHLPRPAGCIWCCFERRLTRSLHGWCLWHSMRNGQRCRRRGMPHARI